MLTFLLKIIKKVVSTSLALYLLVAVFSPLNVTANAKNLANEAKTIINSWPKPANIEPIVKQTSYAEEVYKFNDKNKKQLFYNILSQYRCLVCQTQNLADSYSEFAAKLRAEIYYLIQHNANSTEIDNYLRSNYGNQIRLLPVVSFLSSILWFWPVLLSILGYYWFKKTLK